MLEKCPVDVKILYDITLLQLVKVRKITQFVCMAYILLGERASNYKCTNLVMSSIHLFIYNNFQRIDSVNNLHPIKITIRWVFFPEIYRIIYSENVNILLIFSKLT